MKAILLDDERPALEFLRLQCLQLPELEVTEAFQTVPEALDYLQSHAVDLILTDIEMPGLTGLATVERLRAQRPELGIIFVTGYEEYALRAFELDAVAYLLKPCRPEALRKAVQKATRLLPQGKRIAFRAFGPFTMLVDGVPCRFSNSKAKELLALLVDRRGSDVTMEQAAYTLWEDRPYDHYVKQLYRKLISYLNQLAKEVGGDFFVSARGACHIRPDRVECDYYRLLEGDQQALREYAGIYMSEYSWAEETVAHLDRLSGYYGHNEVALDADGRVQGNL